MFPTTKIKAVSDDDGKGLNAVLDDMTAYTRKVGNPYNLLDNSDFRNPVNQRRQTTYSGAGYSIDRWLSHSNLSSIVIEDGGISITSKAENYGYFQQRLEVKPLLGKKLTFAVKTKNGLHIITGDCPTTVTDETVQFGGGMFDGFRTYMRLAPENIAFQIRIDAGATVTLEWAALYEGEYTAETLPEYQPKGYGNELRECMRYCFVTNYNGTNYTVGMTNIVNTTTANCFIPYPVPLRANPTISDTSGSNWAIIVNGKQIVPDSIAIWYASNTNVAFRAKGTFDSADVRHVGIISSYGAPLVVFSADL